MQLAPRFSFWLTGSIGSNAEAQLNPLGEVLSQGTFALGYDVAILIRPPSFLFYQCTVSRLEFYCD